jgi:copper chaperone CopZ
MATGKHGKESWKTIRLQIQGMHCKNCETLIERRFKKVRGVRRVNANHVAGTAEVSHYGDLDINALRAAIADDCEYTILPWAPQKQVSNSAGSENRTAITSRSARYF